MVEHAPSKADAMPALRVVIVDDHPVVRSGLVAMLEGGDVNVAGEAADGREAVEQVAILAPDAVLMDVRMPDMDGLEATRLIRERDPDVAVVMLTSFENQDYLRRAIQAGATGYLLKGMSRDALVGAIRNAVEGGSTFDTNMLNGLLTDLPNASSDAAALRSLTARERQTLSLVARGLTNRQIADRLGYSVGTIKADVQRILDKLDVIDRTEAAVVATRAGLDLSPPHAPAPSDLPEERGDIPRRVPDRAPIRFQPQT